MTKWKLLFADEFADEFLSINKPARKKLAARLELLAERGPNLGRPYVDSLYGSTFENMKELRFDVGSEAWRFAFAFDPERNAVVLVGGDKQGENQRRFYNWLISTADERFRKHLDDLEDQSEE